MPEKRHGVLGGSGTRGKLGEARRDTANSGEASTLAGGPPVDGAARLLSAAAPASTDTLDAALLLRPRTNQKHGEVRKREGK